VTWWTEIPEEDPGSVGIIAHRQDGVLVLVSYTGSPITGDPRNQDLSVSLDGLIAVARDARINRTTSQAVVDAGERLDCWTFGESDRSATRPDGRAHAACSRYGRPMPQCRTAAGERVRSVV
jgi:hypothetical protein